jgi:hypothetical protein
MGFLHDREWVKRRGRYKDCDADTRDRHQIRPGPQVPDSEATHGHGGEVDYHDGADT